MAGFQFKLLGKFSASYEGTPLPRLEGGRHQLLLCYLLIHRQKAHPRETLSGLFWAESSTSQARKYLRQALWQIQQSLQLCQEPAPLPPLLIDPEWVAVNQHAGIGLDIEEFERLCAAGHGIPGPSLDETGKRDLQAAVALYRGDLVDGCYEDWCLFDRERLQNAYLMALGKLMGYQEAQGNYEGAIEYGHMVLRYDRASERTYAQLMRLYYLAGDRTSALRQYARCTAMLREELGVEPQAETVRLYDQIRADHAGGVLEKVTPPRPSRSPTAGSDTLTRLRVELLGLQRQVDQSLYAIDHALGSRR